MHAKLLFPDKRSRFNERRADANLHAFVAIIWDIFYISTTYQGLSIPESAWTYVLPGLVITNRLLIISIDVKGKDSMILFKIKETAHFNSGHVLF